MLFKSSSAGPCSGPDCRLRCPSVPVGRYRPGSDTSSTAPPPPVAASGEGTRTRRTGAGRRPAPRTSTGGRICVSGSPPPRAPNQVRRGVSLAAAAAQRKQPMWRGITIKKRCTMFKKRYTSCLVYRRRRHIVCWRRDGVPISSAAAAVF